MLSQSKYSIGENELTIGLMLRLQALEILNYSMKLNLDTCRFNIFYDR